MIERLPGTESIHLVRYAFSNIYLIESEGGLVAVDTGIKGSVRLILRKIRDIGYEPRDLHTILLTHAHFDHFGSAAGLQARTGAGIAAHGADLPGYERGGIGKMPGKISGLAKYAMIFSPHCMGARSINVDRVLEDGDRIGDWRVIHTPGHTPGTISLYSSRRSVLITGGWAIDRGPTLRKFRPGREMFSRLVSADPSEIPASRRSLAQLDFQTLLCSHFSPRHFPDFARRLRAHRKGSKR